MIKPQLAWLLLAMTFTISFLANNALYDADYRDEYDAQVTACGDSIACMDALGPYVMPNGGWIVAFAFLAMLTGLPLGFTTLLLLAHFLAGGLPELFKTDWDSSLGYLTW